MLQLLVQKEHVDSHERNDVIFRNYTINSLNPNQLTTNQLTSQLASNKIKINNTYSLLSKMA
jgi:hypothetical protein